MRKRVYLSIDSKVRIGGDKTGTVIGTWKPRLEGYEAELDNGYVINAPTKKNLKSMIIRNYPF